MSSTRRVLLPYAVTNATINATVYSEETDVGGLDNLQYDLIWSAGNSPSIVATVEYLAKWNKDMPNDPSQWVWEALEFTSPVTISGASGFHQLVLTTVPFNRVRLKFARSSGDCVMIATIKGKGI